MKDDVININSPITILLDNRFYLLTKTTYFLKPYENYKKGTHVIFKNKLYDCVEDTITGETPETHKEKFKELKPIDFLTETLTTDDIVKFNTSCVKTVNGIKPINGNIDLDISSLRDDSIKTINGIKPINGNIDIKIPTDYVAFSSYDNCKTIIFENGDSISFNKNNINYNILNYNNCITIGNDETSLNLISKDDATLNGEKIPSIKNVLTLDNKEQLVDGVKTFKQIALTDSPYELNHAVTFQFMNEHIKSSFKEKCKEKLNEDKIFYVSLNGDDNNDGSENFPCRTLEAALQKIYSLNCNNKNITIDFLTDYFENDEIHFLKKCETSYYINIINSKNKKVDLSPFKCSSGKWQFNNVNIQDSKNNDSCFEIKENGFVKFFNVTFKLFNSTEKSDCIRVHHNGTLFFNSNTTIKFINESVQFANNAIHVYKNGTVFGNSDKMLNTFIISNLNGNFNSAFEIECASKCIDFENSLIEVGDNIKQFILRDISSFFVGNSFKSGVKGQKDATSFMK